MRLLAYPRAAAGLVLGLTTGLFLSGVAWGINSTVFHYSTPQTASYTIPAAALAPRDSSTNYFHGFGYLRVGSIGALTDCFQGPVNLPQGAKITKLAIWYRAGAVGRVTVDLRRYRFNNGEVGDIAEITSTDATQTRVSKAVSVSGPLATINNDAFNYDFSICLGTNDTFEGARLTYTYTTAGD
jgi:hypothetical protein